MPVITLISDFGLKDHYVSSLKGAIYSLMPQAIIVDISHQIEKYNIQSAAYNLQQVYKNFPQKTVHLVALNTEFLNTNGYVAVEYAGHFFVAADNGFFSLLFDETPLKIIEIPFDSDNNMSFPARDVFVAIACKLANGIELTTLGKSKKELQTLLPFRASSMGDIIRGAVVYIDSYDNVITNIDKALFDKVGQGQPFVIEFAKDYQIERISKDYNEVPKGEILALFNSSGFLELAMRNGNISGLLHLNLNAPITINFS
jgi:S-adenosylmethionine hydrolase